MFELRADEPGVRTVSVTAWIGGSYLGELRIDVTAERDQPAGMHRDALAEVTAEPTEGAVSLVVRFDPRQNAYRFEFRDEDNPDEVTSHLAYEPGPRVEQLVAGLDDLAKGRSGHSADQARNYLVQSGAALWSELIPPQLREQFWDRQHRIGQLTILADKDAVPWELLYPMDPGHNAGFLVEQFPVTRAIFGRRPVRRLSLWPARFVLPEGSLPEAQAEIDAMRQSLDPGQPLGEVVSALTPLQDLIANGDFGLLHFACHNTYSPADGSSIKLGNVQFTPTLMTTAAINEALARSAPTVFINACRSAGLNATYNRLEGWASKFLDAGAAAFIGTLWAVSDGAAREFAQELYGRLQEGSSLGEAVKCARGAAASQPDDPTWLAYTVYGDPRATLSQQRP
jgi:CHAT domain-containing protein